MPEFDEARRAALMSDLLGVLLRRPIDLLPFDEVKDRLRLRSVVDRGLQDVPLDRIVGSLGREREFNRAFLPREEALRARWDDVRDLAKGPRGFPPVELYQVGDVFFVVDGHHRVSVARRLGAPAIEARVHEFLTPIALQPEDTLRDVVLQSELAEFFEATGLEPSAEGDYRVSEPGGYERLLDHVSVHRYYRGVETGRQVPWDEAVRSWRDSVYRPTVATIRASGILEEFPGRTETDLYLFVMDHLHHLRERYRPGSVEPAEAVEDLMAAHATPVGGEAGLLSRVRNWWRDRVHS